MKENKNDKDLDKKLDEFLNSQEEECKDGECKLKSPSELVERINKKIVTEDGRQLLF